MAINKERLVNDFVELVSIDSMSLNERQMCDTLKKKLSDMGFEPIEDDAGSKTGGQCGNIICTIKGNKNVPAIMMTAHMDTVSPGIGKKAIVEGDIIKSDGTTILGGDDLAGVVSILEAVRSIKEDNIDHGDLQVIFTIAEEGGLLGAKNLDYSKIYAKYGFVMDSDGEVGCAATKAPSQNKIDIIITGKAAHAGIEPEKGISAISIMAQAISQMKLGRIDEETTANIGVVNGGKATNIICDKVTISAEARSRDMNKLEEQTQHMKQCFVDAANKLGGKVQFESHLEYPSFNIDENDLLIDILKKAAAQAGLTYKSVSTGGGSDTNIFNSKGIKSVDLSIAMRKIHSVEEEIYISDMLKSAAFLVEIIKSIE